MTMPENTNMSDRPVKPDCKQVRSRLNLIDSKEVSTRPEYQACIEHLSACDACRKFLEMEQKLESGLADVLKQANKADAELWDGALEALSQGMEQGTVNRRIKYLVSVASAAIILIALFGYVLLQPTGVPANLLYAMGEEHQSFVSGEIDVTSGAVEPEELSRYFRRNNMLSPQECCCSLVCNNRNVRLKGGRIGGQGQCPCATIYAYYNNVPVSFFIWNQTAAELKGGDKIGTDKTGGFNAAVKQLPNCTVGVIGKLDKKQVSDLLKDVNNLNICKCGCNMK